MDFFTNAYLSLAVGIGAVIGWIRFVKIDPAFRPIICLVSAGFIHEISSLILFSKGYSNAVLFNFFILTEALLLNLQFYEWKVVRSRRSYNFIKALLFCWWLTELSLTSISSFSSYFIIFYSCGTALLSISCINQLLFQKTKPLLQDPVFLLCTGFLLYFSFSALVETFWMFGLQQSKIFRLRVHAILCYINLFTNLIFAIAILWMPMRQRYILQF